MIIETHGTPSNPALVLLGGPFCSAASMQPLTRELSQTFYVIVSTYSGCSEDDHDFTNTQEEAQQLYTWLEAHSITHLALALGSSLGANVLMAFAQHAEKEGFGVGHYVFDSGLFFRFSSLIKDIARKKAQSLLQSVKACTHEDAEHLLLNNTLIKKLIGSNTEPYAFMAADMAHVAHIISNQSFDTMLSACLEFDFPAFSLESQRKFLFLWGENDPTRKCEKKTKKAYPGAQFRIVLNAGYTACQVVQPKECVRMLADVTETTQPKTTGVAIDVAIREYVPKDLDPVMFIWNQVVEDGIAFPQDEPLTEATAPVFFGEQTYTGVAVNKNNGEVLGVYILHPNNVGRCGHVCNASYAVRKDIRGAHIGEKMVKDCLRMAHEKGFRILQFNAVVASNIHAIHLYERLGFTTIGRVKEGFRMPDGSYEDTLLFYHPV